ncbi:MAG: tetratricopeptide repeat protein [Candidatus Sericytochromatia bacterium]|nr:tetratricopeptide repeat protein [Candidatus Tanganyikabacteria bacterium]
MAVDELELQIRRANRRRKAFSIVVLAPLVAALLISSVYTFMPFVSGPPEARDAAPARPADNRAALAAAVEANPKDLETLVALANAHYDASDWKQAEKYYLQALALDPVNPDVQVDCGTAILYQDRPLEAIAAYQKALKTHPKHVNAHINLGIAYHSIGKPEKALKEWHDALQHASDPAVVQRIQDMIKNHGGKG